MLHTFIQCKYMGTISKYIINGNTTCTSLQCIARLIVWCLTHFHTMTPFDSPGKQAF